MGSLWLRGTVGPLTTLLGLTSFTTYWGCGVERRWKEDPSGFGRVRNAPCSFGDKHPDSRVKKRCHSGCGSCWEHRIPLPSPRQPARQGGRQHPALGCKERQESLGLKGVRGLAAKGGELVWLSVPWERWKVSAALLATSPVCQSESKAGVRQVLWSVDTLLAAAWEGFALGRGDVGKQWSRAVK